MIQEVLFKTRYKPMQIATPTNSINSNEPTPPGNMAQEVLLE